MNRYELYHYGIKGQKWGLRRFQNADGTFNEAGKARYFSRGAGENYKKIGKRGYTNFQFFLKKIFKKSFE